MENPSITPDSNNELTLSNLTSHLRKGRDGWTMITEIENINGYDWQIRTSKHSKGLKTTANGGSIDKTHPGFSSFKTTFFQDPHITIAQSEARCTEKQIAELHAKALANFKSLYDLQELPSRHPVNVEIRVGLKIFFDSIQSEMKPLVLSKISNDGHTQYQAINPITLDIHHPHDLRHVTKKFGIGYYYDKSEYISDEELFNLIALATEKKLQADETRRAEDILNKQVHLAKLDVGKENLIIPESALAVIIAQHKTNTSDSHTDYFAHTTDKVLYLDWSTTTRQNFNEMRQAVDNIPELDHFKDAPKSWEHRENYSMGAGYYLGEHHHSGWEIRKKNLNESLLNALYVAHAEGRTHFNTPAIKSQDAGMISTPQSTIFTLEQTIHSKKLHQLHVAALIENVNRDLFFKLKNLSRKYEGYYSSYKIEGAIPGFQFREISHLYGFVTEAENLVN